MKSLQLALIALWLSTGSLFAQTDPEDKTEAPLLVAISEDGTKVPLPLTETRAKVDIAGNIANVLIQQTYRNPSNETIEANYVFPGSSQSAVYGLEMTIEDRVIVAEIKEKEEAQEIYEEAKEEGKTAALLEQHRPNVFEMSVGNIRPGDEIVVQLRYTETILPVEGNYQFIYPTVVSQRYDNKEIPDGWEGNPYAQAGNDKVYQPDPSFDIQLSVNAPTPISKLSCKSHNMKTSRYNDQQVHLALDNGGHHNGKDVIVDYSLSSDGIASGLLLFEGKDENFFMFTAQPPKRIIPEQIPAREYIFIIDVSGSMNGFPLDISKEMMRNLLSKLRKKDRFNVLLFADGRYQLAEKPVHATKNNIAKALNSIDKAEGGGGTELLPALEAAMDMSSDKNISKTVVILTDGLVTVEREAFDLIRTKCDQANFFAFGIGSSTNRYLMEGLAHVGNTEPIIVTTEQQAREASLAFQRMISAPVLTNIEVSFDGFKAYDVEPLSHADLFAEKPIVVFGKYKGKPKGSVTLTGNNSAGDFTQTVRVDEGVLAPENQALTYLWARKRIQLLHDYENLGWRESEEHKKEITALGLKYSLLTDYTSFVAVDSEIRDTKEIEANTSAPNAGTVPEPHEWALIILCGALVLFGVYRWKKLTRTAT